MKRMPFTALALLTFLTLTPLALTGCANTSAAGPGTQKSAATTELPSFSETQTVNKFVTLASVKVRVDNVSFITNSTETQKDLKGHIALGLEVGNLSQENVRFYPEQVEVTTDTGEKLFADTSASEDTSELIGGLLPPKRVLQGYLLFQLEKSNPKDIKEIKIKIKAPQNEKGQPLCNDQELVIPIQHS